MSSIVDFRQTVRGFGLFLFYSGVLGSLILLAALTCSAQTNVLTYHNDNGRTGQNLNETILKPTNVNSANFEKLGFLSVDGLVDAEPLYVSNLTVAGTVRNVVFVVTEHDSAYAFDADTFAQLWRVSVLGANETTSDPRGCTQVTPEIGITSTPVIDLTVGPHGTIFLVAMSKDNAGNYYQRLHALDLTTGAEQNTSPTTIQASFPIPNSSGYVTFSPSQYKERAALLLLNNVVYLSWSSHCDDEPYSAWVMGYSESNFQQVNVLNLTPNGSEGAFWMAGGGLAADSSGNIYALDGNGTFDNTIEANGFPSQGDFGNAFLKLSTSSGLAVADFFEMYNGVSESGGDVDLGSGGVMLLPDLTDSSGNVWHLAVGAGKDTHLYVVNRDSMGKFNSAGNNIYQQLNNVLPGGIYSVPAYFNNTVYFGPVGNPISAFSITDAMLSNSATSKTATAFAYPGALPSISANGNTNGILWAVEGASTAVLHAYDATNLSTELYNSNQASGNRDQFGAGNKFTTPMINNGKVYVATPTGIAVFGLINGGVPQAATPTFSPAGSPITPTQPITIFDSTPGATIYYTINGTLPTAIPSEQYAGAFTVSPPATVEAMAVVPSYSNSNVASTSYTALSVSSVSMNPTNVTGGNTSTGTVTLNGAAPSGGAVIALSSTNTSVATVQASATIAAGATTTTFTISTSAVSATSTSSISASYNSTTKSATLTVGPVPVVGAAAFVRSAGNSGESVKYTVSITPATGDFLAVLVFQIEGAATPSAMTDNLGSVYTKDCDLTYNQGSGVRRLTVYHLLNVPAGITGINVTPNKPSRTIVAEYSGMPTGGAVFDVCGTVGIQTTATQTWSSIATTVAANDLVLGIADTKSSGNAGYSASGGWIGRMAQHDTIDADDSYLEDQIGVASGAYIATGTTTVSVDESSVVIAFKTAIAPVAPAITSTNSTTFTVGTAGSFTVTTTGSPTPTLSEAGALPSGVIFTAGAGMISGTPAAGTAGTYVITLTAQNGVGANATQNFTLTVSAAVSGTTFVRSAGSSGESVRYTVSISPTAGDFLAVFVWQIENAATPATVTDNLGTTYTKDCDLTFNQGYGARRLTVYHLLKAPSGITGVNITPNKPSRGIVSEYSGMASTAVLDVCGTVNNQTTSVTSWSSTSATTTAKDLIFGLADTAVSANAGYAASGAWNGRLAQTDSADADDSYLEDQLNVAVGSYTATGTTASAVRESSVVVAFKTGN